MGNCVHDTGWTKHCGGNNRLFSIVCAPFARVNPLRRGSFRRCFVAAIRLFDIHKMQDYSGIKQSFVERDY